MYAKKKSCPRNIEVVLGAGGIKGFGHLGFLRYLEEERVKIGTLTGISIGSLVAAFYANGYKADEIAEIMSAEMDHPDLKVAIQAVLPPVNPLRWLAGGFVNLQPAMRHLVDRYRLQPQENLRIVAYNVWKRQPVVFEGIGYDLATAISASCSIPAVMRPIWNSTDAVAGSGLLVDGGVHHLHPVEFCSGPAVVSKLGPATRFPPRSLPVPLWGAHVAEMLSSLLLGIHSSDPHGDDIVIDVARPDIGGLDFGLPRTVWMELVEYGYAQAKQALSEPIRLQKIPVTL
jgi:hypothetical protein